MRACRQPCHRTVALPLALLLVCLSAPAQGQIFGPADTPPPTPSGTPAPPPSAAIGDVWWAQATGWFCNPVTINQSGNALPVRPPCWLSVRKTCLCSRLVRQQQACPEVP